jgi:DNA-binding response OmpR family regulator
MIQSTIHIAIDSQDLGCPLPATKPSKRILLVDDDKNLRDLVEVYLRCAGYRVDAAVDGEEAWRALSFSSYDLLITDQNMPRLNGLELVARMRAAGMTVPVILISGSHDLTVTIGRPDVALAAFLCKPFEFTEILDAAAHALRAVPTGASACPLAVKPSLAL